MSKVQAGYKSTELGDIPEGWEIVSLVDVADPNKPYALTGGPFGSDLKSEEYTELGVRIIQLQNIKEGYFSNEYKIYTSEAKANQLFNCNIFPNDIIIAKMAEPVARACIMPKLHERYLMASDGIRLAVNEEDYSTKYVMYAINSSYFRQQAIDNSTGTTRLRIGLKTLKRLMLLKPSKEEQQKIATILSTVDKDIEKTEAIIEQTEKVKKGLMQQLLTKGIGHTNFKKTEIGKIPDKWGIKTLGEVAEKIQDGTHFSPNTVENGYKYITSKNIRPFRFDLEDLKYISKEDHEKIYKRCDVKKGDVLLTKDGVNTGNTLINTFEEEVSLLSSVCFIRCGNELNNEYLCQYLNSDNLRKSINEKMTGNAIKRLTLTTIKSMEIALPPIIEQKQIASILSSFDEKISKENAKLFQLTKVKKGLIQSLLTGKVRVKADEAEVTQV